jgi:hypothetical protein
VEGEKILQTGSRAKQNNHLHEIEKAREEKFYSLEKII